MAKVEVSPWLFTPEYFHSIFLSIKLRNMKQTFKSLNPNQCCLQQTRIDIWQFPLHTEFPEAKALLNSEELTRAQRYHFARHQRRFTVARAAMRLILAKYLSILPNQLIFTENDYGKPQLVDASHIEFNLSHSEDLALLAIGCAKPLGVDLEFFAGRPYEGIGSHMFSTFENQALRAVTPKLKPLTFFHIWSQKEALIKACGLGLSYPTQEFDVPTAHSTNQIILDSLHNIERHMVSFMPVVGCCAALCYDPSITDIHYHILRDFNSLLEGN